MYYEYFIIYLEMCTTATEVLNKLSSASDGKIREQIAKMKPRELIQVVQTLARRQLGAEIMFQEQLDLANENARLDDIYPEYKGETINIDGKERTVYNSNGERIAQSEPALRNFYKWFGDSKVVDDQGRPLVVYHGTPNGGFDTFIKDSFFTDDINQARGYAEIKYNTVAPKGQTFSVYLKMSNPFIYDANGHFWNTIDYKGKTVDGETLTKKAKKLGYDGVIIQNVKDPAKPWSFVKNTTDYIVIPKNYKEIVKLEKTIKQVLSMPPVSTLTGQEFQKDGTKLTEKVNNYYKENYNNQVERDGVGVIKLDMTGIKDSKAHGLGRNKAIAFAAVPEVIKNGIMFDEQTKWKGRNYDSVSFIAPITIDGTRYECEVIVKKNPNRTGFYLHEVEIQEKLADIFNGSFSTTAESASSKLSIAKKWQEVKTTSQIKSVDNRGTFSEDTGNIYFQGSVKGRGDTYRGSFDEKLKRIVLNEKSDLSTIQHEFAHYWVQNNFKWARSGLATADWLDKWRKVEDWLGIRPDDRFLSREASERFVIDGREVPELAWAYQGFSDFYNEIYEDELKAEYFDLETELSQDVVDWFNAIRDTEPVKRAQVAVGRIGRELARRGNKIVDRGADGVITVSESDGQGGVQTSVFVPQEKAEKSKYFESSGEEAESGVSKTMRDNMK